MAILKKDKDMKRGGIDFQYTSNVVAVKWIDNGLIVTRRAKGQSAKIPNYQSAKLSKVTTPVWVVLISSIKKTAAYKLNRKSSGGRYYLRLFFDLMNISVVNSQAIYKVLYPKRMELIDFKIILAKSLIVTYNIRSQNTPVSHVSSREVLPASELPVLIKPPSNPFGAVTLEIYSTLYHNNYGNYNFITDSRYIFYVNESFQFYLISVETVPVKADFNHAWRHD